MPQCSGITYVGTLMDKRVDSGAGIDLGDVRKCRVHGLLFDADIADSCPLCERERTDRIAEAREL